MTRLGALACALAGAWVATSPAETVARAAVPPLFPQAAGALEPDLSTTLRIPGSGILSLDFVRFKPVAGISEAVVPSVCGVVLKRPGMPVQALVTVGTGTTRFLTCDGISEDGIARTRNRKWVIALVYGTSTPGGVSTTPVVLGIGPAGRVRIENVPQDASIATLAGLRRVLANRTVL